MSSSDLLVTKIQTSYLGLFCCFRSQEDESAAHVKIVVSMARFVQSRAQLS
jgi:hypothetical protein